MVGVVRSSAHYGTNVQYCVDDMTGPPLLVKQWVGAEASNHAEFYPPTAETVSQTVKIAPTGHAPLPWHICEGDRIPPRWQRELKRRSCSKRPGDLLTLDVWF